MNEMDVGARLKEMRILAGLSQRALADRAGVPHGQISLVETNNSSPSVASLRKILGGFPITMAEFFEPEHNDHDEVFHRADELVDLTSHIGSATKNGRAPIVLRQVGNARAHNLQIMHETYAPGADTGATMLEHAAHEGGIVLSGELEVSVGTRKRVLGAGDSYLFDSRMPHRFRNIGEVDAVVISACSPPYL